MRGNKKNKINKQLANSLKRRLKSKQKYGTIKIVNFKNNKKQQKEQC